MNGSRHLLVPPAPLARGACLPPAAERGGEGRLDPLGVHAGEQPEREEVRDDAHKRQEARGEDRGEIVLGAPREECEGDGQAEVTAMPVSRVDVSQETASKSVYSGSKKNWDEIDADLKKKEEEEKPEGEEALNKLFRDIYGKASDETRRAMNKSFQT